MNNHNSTSSHFMSSRNWFEQVWGAHLRSKFNWVFFGMAILPILLIVLSVFDVIVLFGYGKILLFIAFAFVTLLVWRIVRILTPIYWLRKEETRITWSQIILLLSFACCLFSLVWALNIHKDSPSFVLVTAAGIVLGWVFQETIRSVVAFFYLRANNLLKIGDLISVPSRGIEGFVKGITLTTVTLENWDTTTSAFPTYILHSEHFRNSQRMVEGRTFGRMMKKTFIIDTGWIHTMSEIEMDRLQTISNLDPEKKEFLDWFVSNQKQQRGSILNIELYRQYIYHWLMHHPHVSHEPRLIVRWLEQKPEGMPLQVFVYITDCKLEAYEWQQSQIIEHVIEALAWFNLRLYQTVSGYDASNCNVKMMEKEADYRRKIKDNGEIQ